MRPSKPSHTAALLVLALHDPDLATKLQAFRAEQTEAARAMTLPV